MKIECEGPNDQDARTLLQLLDIATKAGGLSVARAAVYWDEKIGAAMKAAADKPKLEAVSNE